MRPAFRRTTTIDAPPERVWATLVDWEAAPRWMSGVERMTADGPTAPGTHITFHARGKGRPSHILEVEDGRRVVLRSTQGPVTADYTYRVEPAGPGTRVTLDATCAIRGPLAVLGPLLRRAMERTDAEQLEHLGRVVRQG